MSQIFVTQIQKNNCFPPTLSLSFLLSLFFLSPSLSLSLSLGLVRLDAFDWTRTFAGAVLLFIQSPLNSARQAIEQMKCFCCYGQ